MSISVICACKNRESALKISLNSWLNFKEITEIIVVDWGSDNSIEHLTSLDERIKVVRVSDKKYFNQPQPLNLAANLASGKYILKLDTDYVMNPYYNFFESYEIDDDSFVSGKSSIASPEFWSEEHQRYMYNKGSMSDEELSEYFNSYSPYYLYLTGLLYITKENFLKIGGYNENLGKYYAFEDDELYKRLELLGLTHKKLDYDHRLLHIPHPDSKRIENFEGSFTDGNIKEFIESQLKGRYSEQELKWQVEYGVSITHIQKNKELIGEIKDPYTHVKTKWIIKKISPQYHEAEIVEDNLEINDIKKLKNFPTVYYLSLDESVDRQNYIENEFKKFNIKPKSLISKRFLESNDKVTGKFAYQLNDGTKGCCVSHLKTIKDWYENTDENYVFICEDDLSLDTVKYWNFTWEEFIEKIPEDADCVQLLTIRNEYDTFKIRERYWNDWAATAYIITRDHAKKLIDTYIQGDTYHLEIPNQDVMPLIENIIFASVGKCYVIPLFVENTEFNSTFENQDNDVNSGQKTNHKIARDLVLNYWKEIQTKVERTELEQLLYNYSLDTENAEHNFALGVWYENEGHTAPALSYFLRCAERADDEDLAYESLIRGSYCYEKQGERDGSTRSLLWQAQAFRPDRPEAYFLLSRYAEKREWWQDCYMNADFALKFCNLDCPPLRTDVGYPGKYGLLFEKAISGWWWGKVEESRSLLQEILESYDLSEEDYQEIYNTLSKIESKISGK